jgi:hypothetical protein
MEYHFVATVLVEMGLQGILDLDSLRKGIDGGHRSHVILVGEGIVKGHWLLSRKVKYLSHLAKHKGRSIAIVLAIVGAKQAPCFGRRQMLVHAGSPRALGVHGFSGEKLEEERLSYLRSFQRLAAMEHGEVRSVVALKAGVGDHTPERFADHEPVEMRATGSLSGQGRWIGKRLSGLTH